MKTPSFSEKSSAPISKSASPDSTTTPATTPDQPPGDPTQRRRGILAPEVAKEMVEKYRQWARLDPNQFVEYCFTDSQGKMLRQAKVHQELQAFLTEHPRALVELPRDHGKSVQVCARVIWELGRNPALRVKIVCATDHVAAERTRFLRDAICSNPRVREVFPELQPHEPWSVEAFTVARPGHVMGPSVGAFGVGTGSTGTRADLLVCDDVVDVHSLRSKAERERTTQVFLDNLMNLLEPTGRCWSLCTPWHVNDLNARLKANAQFALFRRAVGPNLEPVWPEHWPTERLAQRKAEIGAAAFARGYLLHPIDETEVMIRPEWVQTWDVELPREQFESVVLAVDPAVTAKASADASALVVLGKVKNEVRCLEAMARRVATPELVELIDRLDRQWQPEAIAFESNAAFAGIRDLLVRHVRFGPRVKGLTVSRNKESRVAAFSVPVQNGSFRLKAGPAQQELYEEMTLFPFGPHDDLVDAAAAGTEYLLNHREPRIWCF